MTAIMNFKFGNFSLKFGHRILLAIMLAITLLLVGLPTVAYFYDNTLNLKGIDIAGADPGSLSIDNGTGNLFYLGIFSASENMLTNIIPIAVAIGGVIGIFMGILTKNWKMAFIAAIMCIMTFIIVQSLLQVID